jgi:predicted nucleic acid-binding protein
MAVVVDANLLVALVSGDPRGGRVLQQFHDWLGQGVDLHAPDLVRYELANALTRLVVGNAFPAGRVAQAWADIYAAYLGLAEELGAELYTLDGPLYRNATGQGFRVQLLQ